MELVVLSVGCFACSAVAALLLTPTAMRWAWELDILDHPDGRKIHRHSTPLLGGMAVYAACWLPLGILSIIEFAAEDRKYTGLFEFPLLFFAGMAMLLLGLVDDRRGMRARLKLIIQIPTAVVLVSAGVFFTHLPIPFYGVVELGIWGKPLSIVWLVGVTNAVNLIDGIDGLASGVAAIIALVIAVMAALTGHLMITLLMVSMVGAVVGFLRYNFNPAHIFLGDAGSLFLGITLGSCVILAEKFAPGNKSTFWPAVLVLGYPVADTLLSMVRRTVQGRPMVSPDKSHLHHQLAARGLGQKQIVYILWGFAALMAIGALAVFLNTTGKEPEPMLVASFFLLLLVVVAFGTIGLGKHALELVGLKPSSFRAFIKKRKKSVAQVDPEFAAQLEQSGYLELPDAVTVCSYLKNYFEQLHVMQVSVYIPPGKDYGEVIDNWQFKTEGDKKVSPTVVNMNFHDTGMILMVRYSLSDVPYKKHSGWWKQFKKVAEHANDQLGRIRETPATGLSGRFLKFIQ